VAFVFKRDNAGDFGEQGVVSPNTYIFAGLEFGSALPNQNGSVRDQLAAETLDAQSLGMTIAAVA